MTGANVTGVTLDRAIAGVERRAAEKTRRGRRIFEDYRDISGPFDRIVSVGCSNMSASTSAKPISGGAPSHPDGVMVRILSAVRRPDVTNP
jgi:cyclopropane-fatty-acyl-phospholipid synthase